MTSHPGPRRSERTSASAAALAPPPLTASATRIAGRPPRAAPGARAPASSRAGPGRTPAPAAGRSGPINRRARTTRSAVLPSANRSHVERQCAAMTIRSASIAAARPTIADSTSPSASQEVVSTPAPQPSSRRSAASRIWPVVRNLPVDDRRAGGQRQNVAGARRHDVQELDCACGPHREVNRDARGGARRQTEVGRTKNLHVPLSAATLTPSVPASSARAPLRPCRPGTTTPGNRA